MNSIRTPRFAAFLVLLLAGCNVLPGAEPPQSRETNQSGDATPAPEAVELSPFVVTESQGTGYVAQDTLSGARTRTPLKDVASAIGVFTRDFIDDLGATSEKDILAYSASVVPETGDQTANGRGNSLATPETFNYRIRGQAATRTRNFFEALIPPDTYNVGRFEESRGPNTMLFGMGGAGGILNHSTKRANPTRPQTETGTVAGRYELMRGEIDHNHVLIPKRAGVRINAMVQDSDGPRPFEFSHQAREHVAGVFLPFSRIRINVEAEAGRSRSCGMRLPGCRCSTTSRKMRRFPAT